MLHFAARVLGIGTDHKTSSVLLLGAIVMPGSIFLGWLSRKYVEAPVARWIRARTQSKLRGEEALRNVAARPDGTPAVSSQPAR